MYLNVIGIKKIFRYTEHFVTQRLMISRSYNNSSSGLNLTPLQWSYFHSKKEFKELFFRINNDPKFGVKLGVKVTPKGGLSRT